MKSYEETAKLVLSRIHERAARRARAAKIAFRTACGISASFLVLNGLRHWMWAMGMFSIESPYGPTEPSRLPDLICLLLIGACIIWAVRRWRGRGR